MTLASRGLEPPRRRPQPRAAYGGGLKEYDVSLFFVGRFSGEMLRAAQQAADDSTGALTSCEHVHQAYDLLPHLEGQQLRTLFFDPRLEGIRSFVATLRRVPSFFAVPLIAVIPPFDQEAFAEAQVVGADDCVVSHDIDGVRERLQQLSDVAVSARPPTTEGLALVAHPNVERRLMFGRALRQGGFDVVFAADDAETLTVVAERSDLRLAAASDLLSDQALGVVVNLPAAGKDCAAIVLGTRNGEGLEAAIVPGDVAALPDSAPPQHVVFLANHLLQTRRHQRERAHRMLWAAMCSFRPAGSLQLTYGCTYNVSRDGLYIRTLVPPDAGSEVWVELMLPKSPAALHVRGRVAWTRRYGAKGLAPAGFGVQILADLCPPRDRMTYERALDAASPGSSSLV